MNETTLDRVITTIDELPALPAAVVRLCQLADDPDALLADLAEVITDDQALAARILRVANSAFYGLSRRVNSVSQALVLLGIREVRNLALGVSLAAFRFGKDDPGVLESHAFWRHAVAVSHAAKRFAETRDRTLAGEAVVAGLIHDIGKLVFAHHFADDYRGVLDRAAAGEDTLHALERDVMGHDHAETGGRLCERWQLPVSLVSVVTHHHDSDPGTDATQAEVALLACVRLADDLVRLAGIGASGDSLISDDAFASAGIETLGQVLTTLPDEVARTEAVLHLGRSPATTPHPPVPTARGAVAVLVDDDAFTRLVGLVLITLGYAPRSRETLGKVGPGDLAGLISNGPPPGAIRNFCLSKRVPVLDLAAWRAADGRAPGGTVDVTRMRAWIQQAFDTPVHKESS